MSTWAEQREEHRREQQRTDRRYGERFPGWRKSTAGSDCPRVVAGLRCLAWGYTNYHRCICQRGDTSPIIDHPRLWVLPDGQGHAYTSEPYHVDPEALKRFTADCEELGLVVTLEDYSPYFPGSTKLIVVTRKEPAPPKAPGPRTSRKERRRMMDDRTCFVCRKPITETRAVWYDALGILYHADGNCRDLVRECNRDFSRSKRGRLRSPGETLRLIEERTS